jgi:hypothetical protein
LARQFGAEVVNEISPSVTHIVAVRVSLRHPLLTKKNTSKIKDAVLRYPRCQVVHLNWLLMSSSSWHRQDESQYLLDEPTNPFSPSNGREIEQTILSDEDDDEALSLPSAGVANVRGETPLREDEDVDIAEFDWGDADKEVNDFLAELGEDFTEDSDNERSHSTQPQYFVFGPRLTCSVASSSMRTPNGRKRKRDISSRETSDAEDSDDANPQDETHLRSRLSKRIHTAKNRKSALSNPLVPSSVASPNGSSHNGVALDDHSNANGSAMDESGDEDSDLDDWADEFEKELG